MRNQATSLGRGRCAVGKLVKAICSRNRYEMRRQAFSRRFARIAAGVIFALLAWLALAPTSARAGCSHLVTSRGDRGATLVPSFLRDFYTEPVLGVADPLQPIETPQFPRPCQGAWCAETPSVPITPSGIVSARAELWAWSAMETIPTVTSCSRLVDREADFHASHRSADILRPPRFRHFA
jgi:hypothetical protein